MKKLFTILSIALSALPISLNAQNFGPDVHVVQYSGNQVSQERITVAYNGDVYLARLVKPNEGGKNTTIEVLKSTNNGATWSIYQNLTTAGDNYFTSVDIKACGNNSSNFKLFVVRGMKNSASNYLYILSSYYLANGAVTNMTIPNNQYQDSSLDGRYATIKIVSDWERKNTYPTDYTIGFVALKKMSSADSIIIYTSATSHVTLNRVGVYGTSKKIRSMDADMGSCKSTTSQHGRIGIIWAEADGVLDFNGKIKAYFALAHDGLNNFTSNGLGLFNIDTQFTKYYNPSISLSKSNTLNDISVLMAYESKEMDGYRKMILRKSSKLIAQAPTFSNYSLTSNVNYNRIQPSLTYDVAGEKFCGVVFNSAPENSLMYFTLGVNGMESTDYTNVSNTIRDIQTDINSPQPHIVYMQNKTNLAVVWNDNNNTYFDSQRSTVSISNAKVLANSLNIYPNPANDHLSLKFELPQVNQLTYTICDLNGKIVYQEKTEANAGYNEKSFDISMLQEGYYILSIAYNEANQHIKFVKGS